MIRNILGRKVHSILLYCLKNGNEFKLSMYRKKFREYMRTPNATTEKFKREVLRNLALSNFLVYAACLGFPVYRNKVYKDIYQKRIKNKKRFSAHLQPRGTWKTALWGCAWQEWRCLQDKILYGQTKPCLVVHGGETKGSKNLDLISKDLQKEIIQYLFGDVLQVEIDNNTQLRFIDNFSPIRNKEADFESTSIFSDETGGHYYRFMFDDVGTKENTNTPEKSEKVKIAVYRFLSLEDHEAGQTENTWCATPEADDNITGEI